MFLVRDLGLPPAIVGVSIGIGGIGAFLGTLLAERFTRRFGVGRTIIGSLIIIPLWSGLLLLPLTTWSVSMVSGVLFIMQLMGDIAWSVFFINVVTLRQALIPTHLLGRANASLDFIGEGAGPIYRRAGSWAVATVIGTHATWLVGAAGILTGSLWLIFSPVRGLQALPSEQSPNPG